MATLTLTINGASHTYDRQAQAWRPVSQRNTLRRIYCYGLFLITLAFAASASAILLTQWEHDTFLAGMRGESLGYDITVQRTINANK